VHDPYIRPDPTLQEKMILSIVKIRR